jgi:hypothetical protein
MKLPEIVQRENFPAIVSILQRVQIIKGVYRDKPATVGQ